MKEKVAKHAPTSYDDLLDVIKRVWVQEISPELTDNLIASMPRRSAGVIMQKVAIQSTSGRVFELCIHVCILLIICMY